MTSLMRGVRRADVRRGSAGIVATTFLVALAGCGGDRTSNADDKKPIAVTASGVEIMEVVENKDMRTVEAVVVTGGEERRVTFAPVLDGPLPSGVSASLHASDGSESIRLTYGWDENSGATWFRQQADGDTFEFSRTIVQGRVVEEYAFNEQFLRLQYADLPQVIADKAVEKYSRGESLTGASPPVVEFVGELQEFEAFAAQLPGAFESASDDGAFLTSLLGDPVFAGAIVGEEVTPNRPDGLCNFFNVCMAIACRVLPNPHLCAACTAGALTCLFMDWFCSAWCNA